jgi:hypothetical protein
MTQTKRIKHEDGRIEIVRIINNEVLTEWKEWNPLAYEASIVWLKDVKDLTFVRAQFVNYCTHRRNELIPEGKGKVVGYSRLTTDARTNPKTGYYTRRVFFLLDGENGRVAEGASPPKGAVCPNSIGPSVFGKLLGGEKAEPKTPEIEQWKTEQNSTAKAVEAGTLGVLLSVDDKTERLELLQREVAIGRGATCTIKLPHKHVSSEHCRMTWERDEATWYVVDLKSTGGTFINGERLQPFTPTRIFAGDYLSLASRKYKLAF